MHPVLLPPQLCAAGERGSREGRRKERDSHGLNFLLLSLNERKSGDGGTEQEGARTTRESASAKVVKEAR